SRTGSPGHLAAEALSAPAQLGGVSIPNGLPRPFSPLGLSMITMRVIKFQSRTGSPGNLACYPYSIEWEAKKAKHFREAFREELFVHGNKGKSGLNSFGRACRVLREPVLREFIAEALAKLISLHEKEQRVGWRWSSERFHLACTCLRSEKASLRS